MKHIVLENGRFVDVENDCFEESVNGPLNGVADSARHTIFIFEDAVLYLDRMMKPAVRLLILMSHLNRTALTGETFGIISEAGAMPGNSRLRHRSPTGVNVTAPEHLPDMRERSRIYPGLLNEVNALLGCEGVSFSTVANSSDVAIPAERLSRHGIDVGAVRSVRVRRTNATDAFAVVNNRIGFNGVMKIEVYKTREKALEELNKAIHESGEEGRWTRQKEKWVSIDESTVISLQETRIHEER